MPYAPFFAALHTLIREVHPIGSFTGSIVVRIPAGAPPSLRWRPWLAASAPVQPPPVTFLLRLADLVIAYDWQAFIGDITLNFKDGRYMNATIDMDVLRRTDDSVPTP